MVKVGISFLLTACSTISTLALLKILLEEVGIGFVKLFLLRNYFPQSYEFTSVFAFFFSL